MKKILIVMLCFAMLLGLTACNKSDTSGESNSKAKLISVSLTEEEYAFGVKKGNTELLSQLNAFLAEIKENGTFEQITDKYFGDGEPTPVKSASEMKTDGSQLIVATNAEFSPFEYTRGDSFYGVDMEIMQLFAEKLGKELYINDIEFDAVVLAVGGEGASCDIAASGLTVNDKRKKTLDFSDSYYNASQMLIVKADDKTFDECKTFEDIEKILKTYDESKKCGVQTGTTGQYFCEGDEDWGFEGYAFKTVGYTSGALAAQDMLNGNLDFVIIDEAPAKVIVENLNK